MSSKIAQKILLVAMVLAATGLLCLAFFVLGSPPATIAFAVLWFCAVWIFMSEFTLEDTELFRRVEELTDEMLQVDGMLAAAYAESDGNESAHPSPRTPQQPLSTSTTIP